MARVWGGVHFMSAVEASKEMCRPIGELAYEFLPSSSGPVAQEAARQRVRCVRPLDEEHLPASRTRSSLECGVAATQ
jgi:hypothetical protein